MKAADVFNHLLLGGKITNGVGSYYLKDGEMVYENNGKVSHSITFDFSNYKRYYREMTFTEALAKVVEGKRVKRLTWDDVYVALNGSELAFFRYGELAEDRFNTTDYKSTDWIVDEEGC